MDPPGTSTAQYLLHDQVCTGVIIEILQTAAQLIVFLYEGMPAKF